VFRPGQEARRGEEMSLQTWRLTAGTHVPMQARRALCSGLAVTQMLFFLGTKSDADDANTQTEMRTRPLEAVEPSQKWERLFQLF